MFYEAVGCIVSAEQNATKRDEIIQELFRLPNARWLEIIGLAMQDPTQLHNHDTMRRRPPLPAPLPPLKCPFYFASAGVFFYLCLYSACCLPADDAATAAAAAGADWFGRCCLWLWLWLCLCLWVWRRRQHRQDPADQRAGVVFAGAPLHHPARRHLRAHAAGPPPRPAHPRAKHRPRPPPPPHGQTPTCCSAMRRCFMWRSAAPRHPCCAAPAFYSRTPPRRGEGLSGPTRSLLCFSDAPQGRTEGCLKPSLHQRAVSP